MFIITFEKDYKQWNSGFLFKTIADAEEFLTQDGFKKSSGIFQRGKFGWCDSMKAYITPLKFYTYKTI